MKNIKLKCEIVSPVHIGSGQETEPLSYVIKDDRLYRISFEKFTNIFFLFIINDTTYTSHNPVR